MTNGIKIADLDSSILLLDILNNIEGQEYFWSVLYLEARGDLGDEKSIPDLEERVSESENGMKFDWNSLNDLAGKFDQVIDIVLIGCRDQTILGRFGSDEEMYDKSDIVIEMVDSTYWLIHAQDQSIVADLSHCFNAKKWG